MDLSKTAWNFNMNCNPLKMRSNNFTVHIDMEDPKLADYFLRKLWYFHIVLIISGQGYGFARNSLRCVRQKKTALYYVFRVVAIMFNTTYI